MIHKSMANVASILFIIWFFCIPLFWHFDLAKGTLGFYDTFAMAPNAIFHLIIFYILALLSIYFDKFSLYHMLLFGLYFPFIQLANYPYLTIRDVYLHAGPAKMILINGELGGLTNSVAKSWPGSYLLHSILAIVSGFDLINANYVLYLFLIIALVLILFSLTRTLKRKDYMLAWASTLLFLCLFFNYNFSNFTHYTRNALAFTFLFLFLFCFMRFTDRYGFVLQLFMVISINITHPFQSIALAAFLLISLVFSGRDKRATFPIFSLVAFLGIVQFYAYSSLLIAISNVRARFSLEAIKPIVSSLSQAKILPWWGSILRNYYRYSLVGLFAIALFATILLLLQKRRPTAITKGLSSILFSAIVMLFTLNLLPDWQIGYFVLFAAFPAAFSSFILLEELSKKGKLKKLHRIFTVKSTVVVLLLFIVSLSGTVMVSNFEKNYYLGEVCHPSELSSLSFFFNYDMNSTVSILSWRTAMYTAYFDYNASHRTLYLWYLQLNEFASNSSKILFSQSQLINQSQFVIRGMRDSFTLSSSGNYPIDTVEVVLETIDENMIIPQFDQMYSNGYYSIYKRVISP